MVPLWYMTLLCPQYLPIILCHGYTARRHKQCEYIFICIQNKSTKKQVSLPWIRNYIPHFSVRCDFLCRTRGQDQYRNSYHKVKMVSQTIWFSWWQSVFLDRHDSLYIEMGPRCPGGHFRNAYKLLNLRALKISVMYKNCIFQCMGKIFCVEFQMCPLKFHAKFLTHTLKDVYFVCRWKFESS